MSASHRLLPISLLGLVLACGDGSLLHIEIEGADKVTVPAGTPLEALLGDIGFGQFVQMDITDNQKLKNQGVEDGDISTAMLVAFELEVVEPEDGDLSFIDSMEIWVSAPGLEPRLIASADAFDAGEPVVSFDVEDVNLVDYVISESMTFTTEIDAGRPDTETVVRAAYIIDVGVTAQGARKACQ